MLPLLLAVLLLMWEMFFWLRGIAGALGCDPARTRRIEEIYKTLERTGFGATEDKGHKGPETTRLMEQLQRLSEAEDSQSLPKSAQMVRIIELLRGDTVWVRPETKQLERVIELLDDIKAAVGRVA